MEISTADMWGDRQSPVESLGGQTAITSLRRPAGGTSESWCSGLAYCVSDSSGHLQFWSVYLHPRPTYGRKAMRNYKWGIFTSPLLLWTLIGYSTKIHLFAIGGGQSPKLIQHRRKTRHLTQQLVQRDWPMCVTIRRNLVSVRHSA